MIGEEKSDQFKNNPWIKFLRNKSKERIDEKLEEERWEIDNQEEDTPNLKAIGEILWVI